MSAQLKRYLQQYAQWPGQALDHFVASFKTKKIKRGQYLLRAGEVCRDFIFLESGCLRYFLPSEIELTVWIAFPGSLGSEVQSFISEQPSRFFVQAIEPVEVLSLPKSALLAFYQTQPPSQEMIRRIWEEGIVHIIDRMIALQCEPAEKRYLDLIRYPDYLQRIPQKYLASYLGVTPSSLSRLRRKIR
jgi:CRP-like cAMP-binding protein